MPSKTPKQKAPAGVAGMKCDRYPSKPVLDLASGTARLPLSVAAATHAHDDYGRAGLVACDGPLVAAGRTGPPLPPPSFGDRLPVAVKMATDGHAACPKCGSGETSHVAGHVSTCRECGASFEVPAHESQPGGGACRDGCPGIVGEHDGPPAIDVLWASPPCTLGPMATTAPSGVNAALLAALKEAAWFVNLHGGKGDQANPTTVSGRVAAAIAQAEAAQARAGPGAGEAPGKGHGKGPGEGPAVDLSRVLENVVERPGQWAGIPEAAAKAWGIGEEAQEGAAGEVFGVLPGEEPEAFGRRLAEHIGPEGAPRGDVQGVVEAAFMGMDPASLDKQERALSAFDVRRLTLEKAAELDARADRKKAIREAADMLAELVRSDVLQDDQAEQARAILARAGVEV